MATAITTAQLARLSSGDCYVQLTTRELLDLVPEIPVEDLAEDSIGADYLRLVRLAVSDFVRNAAAGIHVDGVVADETVAVDAEGIIARKGVPSYALREDVWSAVRELRAMENPWLVDYRDRPEGVEDFDGLTVWTLQQVGRLVIERLVGVVAGRCERVAA